VDELWVLSIVLLSPLFLLAYSVLVTQMMIYRV
jgi:hypothetical protein